MRKAIILTLSLIIVLVGISVINTKLHFSSKINKLTGEVAGIFLANKFLDTLIDDTVSAQISSPYQDVAGDVAISGKVGISENSTDKANLDIKNTNATVKTAEVSLSGGTWGWALTSDYFRNGGDNFVIWGGGAGAARLFIDSDGKVGIGTAAPQFKLHFINNLDGSINNTGTAPNDFYWNRSARFETTLTGNNSPKWAGAAVLSIYGKNAMASSTQWNRIDVITAYGETITTNQETTAFSGSVKLTGGSSNTDSIGNIFWALDDNASTNGTVYGLRITLDDTNLNRYGIYQETANPNYFAGNIGIGTANPTYKIQLSTDSAGKPGGGSWGNSSDIRLKKNVQPITKALDKILKLQGVNFEWVNPEEHGNMLGTQGGFIAQEIKKIFPNWITEIDPSGKDKNLVSSGKIESLSLPFEFDALLVEAIKEQQAQIKTLQAENANLKLQLESLNSRLKALETKVQ